jgi:outer membrane lipoprotein
MIRSALIPALFALATALLASSCATPVFEVGSDVDRVSTPREAVLDPATVRNRAVAWGGLIVSTVNLKDVTQIEIVGYPLDDSNRPRRGVDPVGRFIVLHPGYLETTDYASGREITVVGKVSGTRTGKVGETSYVYPVLETSRVQLWPKPEKDRPDSSIHFGIGIGVTR